MKKKFIYILFSTISVCFAQTKKKDSILFISSLKNAPQIINSKKDSLERSGYFFYQIQKVRQKDSIISYKITLGKKVNHIYIKEIPTVAQEVLKIKKDSLVLKPTEIESLLYQLKNHYKKNGFSFIDIQLKDFETGKDTLLSKLHISKTPKKRYIDKIVIKGYDRFPKSYIKHYLKYKRVFNDNALIRAEQKINYLPFVENIKKPAALFTNDSTHLYLYLKRKKANQLDALLGFTNEENSGKIRFNGHIDVSLINSLHKGETFAFKWKNNGNNQEELNAQLQLPYIFRTPISLGYTLDIFRRDSAFVNTKNIFNFTYQPHFQHKIKANYKTETSSIIENNLSVNVEQYQKSFLGIGYEYNKINTNNITTQLFAFNIAIGTKETETKINQREVDSNIIYTHEVNYRNHIFLQNRNAYLQSDNINFNELYRIGGATTIRGFLEQSIFAHLYNYTNIEYRFYSALNSYLYGFSDVGYIKNISQENNLVSFGIGYTLGTKNGLFKISYAVGKSNETQFDLSTGLFHVNFVTLF